MFNHAIADALILPQCSPPDSQPPHTIVLSGFVHACLLHLIFNMMTFYFFGFLLERALVEPSACNHLLQISITTFVLKACGGCASIRCRVAE